MPTRLSASGRVSSPFSSVGSASGSVFALRIFCAMVSASSVRLIRLRHLFRSVAQAHHARRGTRDQGLGQRKEQAVIEAVTADRVDEVVVEFLRDIARQLQMLLLVLANGHVGGAVKQDVGRHQHRIVVKTHRRIFAILASLLLELRHAVEPADAGDAVEDPGKLGVAGDLALVEDDVLLRIDAACDEGGRHFPGVPCKLGRPAPYVGRLRDRMQVDDAIDAIMRLLQFDEVHDRAEVIAEMQIAGRLDARKNPFNEGHRRFPVPNQLALVCQELPCAVKGKARLQAGRSGLRRSAAMVSRQPVMPKAASSAA